MGLITGAVLDEHGVGYGWPGTTSPCPKGEVAEGDESHACFWINPEKSPAPAEVPERRSRIARARPMRCFCVFELEAQSPITGMLIPESRQNSGKSRKRDGNGVMQSLSVDEVR